MRPGYRCVDPFSFRLPRPVCVAGVCAAPVLCPKAANSFEGTQMASKTIVAIGY